MPRYPLREPIKIVRMNMRFLRILAACLLLVCINQHAASQQVAVTAYPSDRLPLPNIQRQGANQPIELRVAHIINPRLPRMSDAQIAQMLNTMAQATQEHLGIAVQFSKPVEIPIAAAFASIPSKFEDLAKRNQYNFRSWFAWKSSLAKAYARGLANEAEPLDEMALFAQKKGIKLDARNYEVFGKDLANLQLTRVHEWQQLIAADGKSVIDDKPYHEYTMWGHLGYGNLPFEMVITNQIIASVEFIQPSVHTAIRGGYTNGLTSYNPQARWGSFSVWSTFAFTSNDAQWLAWREGESYQSDEAAQLAGLAAVHELGHQLLHLLHPFGQKGCIMDPVPMFTYRAWALKLSAKDCPLGSSKAMTPGAHRFTYLIP